MTYKEVLNVVPTMQSLAIANEAYGMTKKKKKKKFIEGSVNIMAGVGMTKATAQMIGSM